MQLEPQPYQLRAAALHCCWESPLLTSTGACGVCTAESARHHSLGHATSFTIPAFHALTPQDIIQTGKLGGGAGCQPPGAACELFHQGGLWGLEAQLRCQLSSTANTSSSGQRAVKNNNDTSIGSG